MVVVAAALLTLPLWFILWFLASLNDKLDGYYPTPWGYVLTALLSTAAAALAWGLVRGTVRLPVLLVVVIVVAIRGSRRPPRRRRDGDD